MIAAVAAGLGIGARVGLLGGGGSILAVPALVYLAGQELPQAVATSLVIIAANSAAGFAAHAGEAALDVPVTAAFTAAAVVAALAGGRLGSRIDTTRLRCWFAYRVLVVAACILGQIGTSLVAT